MSESCSGAESNWVDVGSTTRQVDVSRRRKIVLERRRRTRCFVLAHDGDFYAFDNICIHRQRELVQGRRAERQARVPRAPVGVRAAYRLGVDQAGVPTHLPTCASSTTSSRSTPPAEPCSSLHRPPPMPARRNPLRRSPAPRGATPTAATISDIVAANPHLLASPPASTMVSRAAYLAEGLPSGAVEERAAIHVQEPVTATERRVREATDSSDRSAFVVAR